MQTSVLRSMQATSRRVCLSSRPITRGATQLRFASNNPQAASNQASPGQSSNTRPTNPASSTPDSASINSSRATDSRTGSPDTASVQNPVSNPSQGGAAQQEEPQQSWENVRRDPSEPDEVKRAHVEKEGQKPLDPADK